MEKCTIQILSGGRVQEPAVVEGITWETTRMGEPGKLTFTCVKDRDTYGISDAMNLSTTTTNKFVSAKDGGLSFGEGAQVIFRYGDKNVFSGFVFEKRRNKDHHIEVTCYDRLRYFKNKENYVFTNVRLDQIVTRIAQDMGFRTGEISNTKYVIPKFAAQDSTLFDIVDSAIAQTVMATRELYCLYDDYGKICLKHLGEMLLPIAIDQDTFEDFDYVTSIESNTYNQVVVKPSEGEPIVLNNARTQEQWGVLQTVVDYQGTNPKAHAQMILDDHNRVTRSLTVNGQFGDIRVRGGSGVYLSLHAGDTIYNQIMYVEKVTHTFDNGDHYMDLTLVDGRGFYG